MWKNHNFYEKSPFCHGVDPGNVDFSPFCREIMWTNTQGETKGIAVRKLWSQMLFFIHDTKSN